MSCPSVLPKNTRPYPRPGLEPGLLAPEMCALAMRPPCLPVARLICRVYLTRYISLGGFKGDTYNKCSLPCQQCNHRPHVPSLYISHILSIHVSLSWLCGFSFRQNAHTWTFASSNCFSVASNNLAIFPGGGGTAIYGLYRYVPLWRVWFSSSLL